jgi:molybdopterin synthase catalytic subunit
MQIRVIYFAVLRELIGTREELIQLPEGSDVAALQKILIAKYPQIADLFERIAFAVDHSYAQLNTPLREGSEIAMLPPVAGGNIEPASLPSSPIVSIREIALDPAEVSSVVQGPFGGALVSFVGIVREQNKGRQVTHLVYEAYGEMAVRELQKIVDEIGIIWPDSKVAIHHRVGTLHIGEIAVVIAVCSPHRQNAFAACSHAIEQLKVRVPIWKREFFTDGEHWAGWGA